MDERARIKFNPVTGEIEVEGSEEFVKTYFAKLQKLLVEQGAAATGQSAEHATSAGRKGDICTMVLATISESAGGIKMADIREKTGLTTQQIRSVVYRAEKQGKIRREHHGLYAAV